MSPADDEGAGVIAKRFNKFNSVLSSGFGENVDLEKREADERRATKTTGQKRMSQGRNKLINFKTTETFRAFLKGFAAHEKDTMTNIIEEAVKALAAARGYDHDV